MRAAAALGCQLFEQDPRHHPARHDRNWPLPLNSNSPPAWPVLKACLSALSSPADSAAALPHGQASRAKLPRRGFVTLDFGVVLDGYCSDMTRTVHLGRATAAERNAYEVVLEAQENAVSMVRAGVFHRRCRRGSPQHPRARPASPIGSPTPPATVSDWRIHEGSPPGHKANSEARSRNDSYN